MKLFAVGIDEYYDLTRLHSCVNDAKDYFKFFKNTLGVPENDLICLTRFNHTKKAYILDRYLEFVKSLEEGQTGYFTYSAHGDVFKFFDGEEVLFYEGVYTSDSAIYEYELQNILSTHLNSKARLVSIIDSCHSGGIKIVLGLKNRSLKLSTPNFIETRNPFAWVLEKGNSLKDSDSPFLKPLKENRITISACEDSELAFADRFNGKMNGVLTHKLISILMKNSNVTFEELINELNIDLPNLEKGYNQTPKIRIEEKYKQTRVIN